MVDNFTMLGGRPDGQSGGGGESQGSYGNSGGWIPVGSGGGSGEVVTSGAGRVINGRGYTQIRERSPEPVQTRTRSSGVSLWSLKRPSISSR